MSIRQPATEQQIILGVTGLYQSSTSLTRTDDAVGMTWSMVNNEIVSDFDSVFPFNKMKKQTVDGNEMVYVPKMYWRFTKDASDYITSVAVSNMPFVAQSGQVVGQTEAFYYGAYKGSVSNSKLSSKTGVAPQYSQTRATFRTQAQANGSGYQIVDLVHTNILEMLWLIEFATKNSDSVMKGYTYGGTTGATDNLTKPSGQLSVGGRMRYRYIEDFIGNGYEFFDGITGYYATANPSQYADSQVGTQFSGSGIANEWNLNALGFVDETQPLLIVPKLALSNTSYNTYFCDQVTCESGERVYMRGRNSTGSYDGLCSWLSYAYTFTHASVGSRLIKI